MLCGDVWQLFGWLGLGPSQKSFLLSAGWKEESVSSTESWPHTGNGMELENWLIYSKV